MARHTVRIEIASSDAGTRVLLDGVEVAGLTNVRVEHPVGEWPRVTLELLPKKVEMADFTGDVEVVEVTSHSSLTREYRSVPKRR